MRKYLALIIIFAFVLSAGCSDIKLPDLTTIKTTSVSNTMTDLQKPQYNYDVKQPTGTINVTENATPTEVPGQYAFVYV